MNPRVDYGESTGRLKSYTAKAPTAESITRLVQIIAKRVNKHLLKKGYLEEFEDLTVPGNTEDIFSSQRDDVHLPAQGASVGYRIAFGPQAGQPVRRIKTSHSTWPAEDDVEATSDACVKAVGFSVHAATAMKSHERERMENLARYMARPAISEERLTLLPDGSIRLQLKTSWRDGTQFLLFTPSEFIEKLTALVPLPKFHLTRYYGVFAKASKFRDKLPDRPPPQPDDADDPNASSPQPTPPRKNKLLSPSKRPGGKKRAHKIRWAALLKRTFAIDVLQCGKCKSRMSLVAVVCDSPTIQTTLTAMGLSPRP
ncbi:MAG: hypothetical protein EB110_13185, partial [Betaproteobacteria bacterium]|nr:hypothetical protein [Betaproteobacteria bacterium]